MKQSKDLLGNGRRLLYGTIARDNDGNVYFVGRQKKDGGFAPNMLRAKCQNGRSGWRCFRKVVGTLRVP